TIQERFSLSNETTRSSVQRHPLIATLAGALVLAAACGGDDSAGGSATGVVTAAAMGDGRENMVGDFVTVEVLRPRGAAPHEFQPSARQVVAISEADLLVANGGGLEAGLDDAIDAAADDGLPVFAAIEHVDALEPAGSGDADAEADANGDAEAEDHADDADDSDEDEHGHDVDPHFSTDVSRMAQAAGALADTLVAEVPALDTDEFRRQAEAYVNELVVLDGEVDATIAAV